MIFPVQLVTSNLKDESGEHYYQNGNNAADQNVTSRPQRPKLEKRGSSSSSIRSWSSKSSFGRSLTNVWDAMPVYNTNMHDPTFFKRRDGRSLGSSAASSRAGSMLVVPSVGSLPEEA